MKTSININLFGTLYAIDEDAQQLLDHYLKNMKSYFARQEGGDEIADDLEHRIAELFWELKQQGNESISIEQVTEILHKIGNPEEIGQQENDNTDSENKPDETQDSTDSAQVPAPSTGNEKRGARRFYRDTRDKLLGGVLSGTCQYFGWSDPLALRILFVVLCFVTEGLFVWLYLLLWLIAPKATTCEQRLMMQGRAVTPDNIRSEVLNNTPTGQPAANDHSGCLKALLAVAIAPFGCIAVFVIFILIIVMLSVVLGLFGASIGVITGGNEAIADMMASERGNVLIIALCVIAGIALPVYGLYRWFRRDTHTMSSYTAVILAGLWLIAVCMGYHKWNNLRDHIRTIDWSSIMAEQMSAGDNGLHATESFQTGTFSNIEIEGVGNVTFRQCDSSYVELAGNMSLVSETSVEVEDQTLRILTPENAHNGNLHVRIYSPTLRNVSMQGVGKMMLADTVRQEQPVNLMLEGVGFLGADCLIAPKITACNEGVGACELNVICDTLSAKVEGVGIMKLSGQTHVYQREYDQLTATIKDSGLERL